MDIFAILIPLHSLPMVLMSSFPQNGSFHPSPCVQSHRCSMAEAGLLEETSIYKDLDLEKTDSLQMQRNNTTLQPAQASSAEHILGAPFLQWGEKSKKWTFITPFLTGQGWQTNYQVSNRYSIFTGNFSFPKFNKNQGNTLADIHHQQPPALSSLLKASSTSHSFLRGEMPLQIVCHKRQHKHLTTPSLEKYEATLSCCGANISNTHFLSYLLT